MTTLRWTTADIESLPEPLDDTRYEIIDGELFVSTQPSAGHQFTSTMVATRLTTWNDTTRLGLVLAAPGVIFADDDNVAPDVVWISRERLRTGLWDDGKLHDAPELMVEVLSPGAANEHRDRQAKLKLYSRRGVVEYWVFDPLGRSVDVFRSANGLLVPVATLSGEEHLTSPLLPGFSVQVDGLFFPQDL